LLSFYIAKDLLTKTKEKSTRRSTFTGWGNNHIIYYNKAAHKMDKNAHKITYSGKPYN